MQIPDNLRPIIVIFPVLLFMLIFFYWPLITVLVIALKNPIQNLLMIISDPLFMKFIFFTITQAILTVILSVAIGLPTGYLLARKNPYFISWLRSLITIPFLIPPIVIVVGFAVLFGRFGVLNSFFGSLITFDPYTFWGIVLAHTLYNISVVARITESGFASEPLILHSIADTLGANKIRKFRTITLPHIKPSLEAAMLLVFLYSFNSFAVVFILGQVKLQTIEVMIYTQSRIELNYSISAFLVLIQLLINFLVIIFYITRQNYESPNLDTEELQGTSKSYLSTLLIFLVILITWSPIIVIIVKMFNGIFTLPKNLYSNLISNQYNIYLGTSSLRVIFNTIFIAIIVALFALIFSGLVILATQYLKNKESGERLSVLFILLPMATSPITISFGILLTHGKFRFFSNYVWIYIIAAQLIAALPFASRTLFSGWKRIPQDLIQVAETLGSNKARILRTVIIPLLESSIMVAILFSLAISIGEFGATFYLVRGEWVTLSIAIERIYSSQNIILPYFYACLLILTAVLIFYSAEKIGHLELRL